MRLMARILEGPRGAIGKGRGKRERAVNEEESRVNVFFFVPDGKTTFQTLFFFSPQSFPFRASSIHDAAASQGSVSKRSKRGGMALL